KHIYGMQPWPCATAELGGTAFKIFSAEQTGRSSSKEPGTVVAAGKKGIEVVCGGGETVLVTELQAAGGKRMTAGAYLLGHPMEV
ncbi:MAG: methionyl-tRNA formyltransferase, partial [Oscillospiraceae bacterium]|nr:methionyl-tRNA formyltransferase [Oscillospiraceae bacterium]